MGSRPGKTVGPPLIPDYQLIREIGAGAYGGVWLARNLFGEFRAVKLVWRCSFGDDERPFRRELEGIKRFEPISRSHPSQLAILHVGQNDQAGCFYYVMELADPVPDPRSADRGMQDSSVPHAAAMATCIRGTGLEMRSAPKTLAGAGILNPDCYAPHTLRHDLRTRNRLPVDPVVELGLTLAEALGHLHAHGLVHRDIKPSNIVFVKNKPKLADIGLVTDAGDERSILGTEGYLAPEGPGKPAADIYSLGKVLYEAAIGRDRRDFPDLPENWQDSPDRDRLVELNEILLKACATDPRDRYRSADEMASELALLQQGASIKRKRTIEQVWATGKKIAAVGIPLALVISLALLVGRFFRTELPAEGPPSTNMLANALCEKAFLIIRGDDYARCAEAYTNFIAAIAEDPTFPRPYAGLFELGLREWTPIARRVGPAELRSIARKLQELGPNLAATYCARAVVSYFDLDFPRARELIRKAVNANPKYEPAHTAYGFMLMSWGWPIEARKQLVKSMETAASKVTIYCSMGHTYRLERDYTNAIVWYQKALSLEPQYQYAYGGLKETYEAMGDYPKSIENFYREQVLATQDEAGAREFRDSLLRAFKEGGKRGYYQQLWGAEERYPNEDFYEKAWIQIRLGNTNAGFHWLSKSVRAVRTGSVPPGNLQYLLVHEHWDSVRQDPRFKAVLRQTTFSRVMPSGR